MARSLKDEATLLEAWESARARLLAMIRRTRDGELAARIDALEVLASTLRQAHREWPEHGCDCSARTLYCWLYGLARGQVLQAVGVARRLSPVREPSGVTELAPLAVHPSQLSLPPPERRRLVRSALAQLDGPDREVVVLRFVDGFTFAEISQILGISAKVVSSQCVRALLRLGSLLPRASPSPIDSKEPGRA